MIQVSDLQQCKKKKKLTKKHASLLFHGFWLSQEITLGMRLRKGAGVEPEACLALKRSCCCFRKSLEWESHLVINPDSGERFSLLGSSYKPQALKQWECMGAIAFQSRLRLLNTESEMQSANVDWSVWIP